MACILGGAGYFLLRRLPIADEYAYMTAIILVIGVRLLAVKFKVGLPNPYSKKEV